MGDVVDVRSGKDYKHLSEGNIPVYGTGGFMLNVNQALSYDEDAIGIGRKGTIDKPYILKAPFWTVDTLFYAIPREKVDLNFAFDVFQNIDWKKKDESTGVPSLSKTAINEIDVLVPQYDEQQPLGQFFNRIDNLITLHQCKCQIDGCRFQSPLAITWEQRKLSEIATMHARIGWQNLRTSEFLDNGDYMLITGTDFMDGAVNFDTCHYVERERYEQDKHIQIRNGSILITKDGTLGKVAYIQGLTMPATLNAGVFNVEIRDEKEVDNRYLFQYLKAPFLMDYVDKKATGGTIKHLNQNILVDFPVVLPQKDEQAKIGEYFLGIDNLITLHQRKYNKLTNVKKSMLEKMFPQNGSNVPEIRFKGFTEAWEQRKVSELFKVTRGYVLAATLTEPAKTDEMPYPVYSSQTKDNGLMGYYKDYLYEDAITWTTDGANAGTVNYRAGKFYCTNVCGVLLSNEVTANQMIAEALNNVAKGYVSYVGNPKLMNNVMADIEIMIPTHAEEREKLSVFFRNLDNLITLHQRELEKLKNLKKACLEKMFV